MSPEERAQEICKGVRGPLLAQALELATNVCFMADKLDEERDVVGNMHPFVTMQVGDRNPHTVMRPNPAWRGYTDLVRSFSSALHELRDMLGDAGVSPERTSTLDKYRKKFKAYGGGSGHKEE